MIVRFSHKSEIFVFLNTDTTTWSMYNRSKLEKVLNVVFLQQKKIHGLGIKLHNKTTLVLARYLQKRAGSRCFYFLCTKRTQWRKSLWSMQRLHCAQHVTWKAKLARIWVVSFFSFNIFFCEMTKSQSMVFCYQNCSDLLWEKIVLVIEKNFRNSRLSQELAKFLRSLNNLFKQWKARTIFVNRMLF